MSKKQVSQKPYKFPKTVYVTHEVDENDRDGDGYLLADDDNVGISDGVPVGIYLLSEVMSKRVAHSLEVE
jgi:hypothetical protein